MTRRLTAIVAAVCVVATGCASVDRAARAPAPPSAGAPPRQAPPGTKPGVRAAPPAARTPVQTGKASWYGDAHHGQPTASGERYDMGQLTAAHRTLPLGTRVRVTNVDNGRSVVVRINDRGPFVDGRVIDLSRAAARALGPLGAGVFTVRVEVLEDAAADSTPSAGAR